MQDQESLERMNDMSFISRLKNLFSSEGKIPDTGEDEKSLQEDPSQDDISPEFAGDQVSKEDEQMLELLDSLPLKAKEQVDNSFTAMHFYRFERELSDEEMLAIVKGMKWLGMRFYGFIANVKGEENACPNWLSFLRTITEDHPESVSLAGAFGGVRLSCVITSEGLITFSHDINRQVDLSPFDGLFDPETAE